MIARKSTLIISTTILNGLLGYVALFFITKYMSPEEYGTLAFAYSFVALFNILGQLGFDQAHIKRISEGKDLGSCIGTFIAIKLALTGLMVSVFFIYLFIWKNVLNEGFYDATTESVVLVFVAFYIFTSLQGISIHTFTATREIVKKELPTILGRITKVTLLFVVLLAGVNAFGIAPPINWPTFLIPLQKFISDHPVGSLAMTYVFDMMIVFIAGIWLLRKYPIKRPSWNLFKSYSSFALPLIISSVISIISLNIDKIMIGYFWTSTEVGYYFVVQRIFEFITPLSTSVTLVLFPTISSYHSKKNIDKIVEVEAPSILDQSITAFMKAVEDEEDEAGNAVEILGDYYFDEVSITKVYDEYNVAYEDEKTTVDFSIKLQFDDGDDREKESYDVTIIFEEDEDTEVIVA